MKKLLVCAFVLASCSFPLFAQQVLKVGYSESGKPFQPLLTAIYKEAGLVPEYVLLPLERSMRSVDSGEVDADIGRAAGTIGAYPNAIETTESIMDMHILAVVKKDFKATKLTPADLKKYKLGHLRGGKLAEALVKSLGVEADLANTLPQVFQMVATDRFDVALNISTTPLSGFPEFESTLMTLPQPLLTHRTVHVLNKKWAAYAPKIDAAIKTMKADGRIAKLLAAPR